ncbi:MAG: bifunctional heptose 7-phosphate kinase/heptose 1-phosphate adenyltransferase [Planctomycetota bacterium]|nr:MAG: bifunctional heptose 7-phosphate kinase/heptose 1-phosphate adenyltransferase [Planctomycetota bacterium]
MRTNRAGRCGRALEASSSKGAGGAVDAGGLLADGARPTTVKRNMIGLAQSRHPQKMFRVDYESREPLGEAAAGRVLEAVRAALADADVLCIEDYAKGVCSAVLCGAVIGAAREAGVPVFVDPAKLTDYARYRGCTAITPNRTEAEHATGLRTHDGDNETASGVTAHNAALAAALGEAVDCDAVVMTLDRHGALVRAERRVCDAADAGAAGVRRDGRGGCVLAGLAAGRANGLGWQDATRLANVAAGIAVESFGAVAVPIERVHQQVIADSVGEHGKLRSIEQLLVEVRAWRAAGKRIVFTNGCFDVLHAGHVSLLDRAKKLGDVLIVATNTDERVREFKGPNRPVNGLAQRAAVLSGLAAVDAVVVFEEETPREVIERIGPDVLAKGDEYEVAQIPGASFVLERGGTVERLPMVEGYSTTATLRAMGDARAETSATGETRARFVEDR